MAKLTGTMRWHAKWHSLMSTAVARNFSKSSACQLKGGLVFEPETIKKKPEKIRSVGSFDTSLGACGPLIDGPDYTFLDGRPTPLRVGQMRRAKAQREAAAKVVQLMKETQFAMQREQQMRQDKEERKQLALQAKLKPKGHKLLQDKEK